MNARHSLTAPLLLAVLVIALSASATVLIARQGLLLHGVQF